MRREALEITAKLSIACGGYSQITPTLLAGCILGRYNNSDFKIEYVEDLAKEIEKIISKYFDIDYESKRVNDTIEIFYDLLEDQSK